MTTTLSSAFLLVPIVAMAFSQENPSANPAPNVQAEVIPWIAASGDGSTVAALVFGSGVSLSVVCRDEQLLVLIGGLPPVTTSTRNLQVNLHSETLRDSQWISGSDQTTAISMVPAVYARAFRAGGQFTARVPRAEGSPARRYVLPLPSETSVLDAVIKDCDVPLVRETDLTFDPSIPPLHWDVPPRPNWPGSTSFVEGAVVISCMVQSDGRLDDCEIESQEPRVAGFGRAALAGARSARLKVLPGGQIGSGRVTFTTRFRMDGSRP